jgi:hypothetical protein
MKVRTVAIIGVGAIGSRHLQGILKYDEILRVYAIEPNEASRDMGIARANEISHGHEFYWLSNVDELPAYIDICFITTVADIRARIIEQLLASRKVDCLILEKVLFNRLDDYSRISNLFENSGVNCFVNHPRRMFPAYQDIKNKHRLSKARTVMSVYGNSWGLGCNSLHFLDLFHFLTESKPTLILTDLLDSEFFVGKRNDTIEFSGSIAVNTEDGDHCIISSMTGPQIPMKLCIRNSLVSIEITEQNGINVQVTDHMNSVGSYTVEYGPSYQSDLSHYIVKNHFEGLPIGLPKYDVSREIHEIFINSLLRFCGLDKSDKLRIT